MLDWSTVAEIARFEAILKFDALVYGGLLEPRGSKLTLLKSTFNAENFIRRLVWSICSDVGAIHS